MGSDSMWLTCVHVVNGSAVHVKMRPEKMCLCSACVESVHLIKTNEICIMDQDRLECILIDIEKIDGLWHLGKYRDQQGNFAPERRSQTERRSRADRRLVEAYLHTDRERRNQYPDRRMTDRRAAI